MASSAPPLIGFGSLMVVTTCSLRKLVSTIDAYIGENLWEIVIDTLINFPVSGHMYSHQIITDMQLVHSNKLLHLHELYSNYIGYVFL
jgi:hypothetical protein